MLIPLIDTNKTKLINPVQVSSLADDYYKQLHPEAKKIWDLNDKPIPDCEKIIEIL